jgi:ABC-2 type transport system ATP-binding protein/lipopolysaccharide transport system ATP-binding protein
MNTLTVSSPPGSLEKPAILFENVSVRYRLPRERVSGIKEYTIRWLQRRITYQDFWALHGVSFTVHKGEVLGVIGRNGAGKSTLLKVMARVLHPTEGRVVMRGRIAPLLELGGGFHPELTGRENVFLNLALLGRSREESEALFDSILDFAEIHDFINAPLRTYSTGMVARLGFSVATSVRPDILLVDEVLSVGDTRFQEKCLDRMFTFQSEGTTIVFVSHSLSTVESFCDQVLWLDGGQAQALGPAPQVIDRYMPPDPARQNPLGPAVQPRPAIAGEEAAGQGYASLPEVGQLYSAAGIFNVEAGSLSLWLKLAPGVPDEMCVLFHSDDSRYVLYIDVDRGGASRWLAARAGGNRKAFDPASGKSRFPEITALIGAPAGGEALTFPEDEWRRVTVTWEGYPRGLLRLYLGAELVGERRYDRRYDDSRGLPGQLSVGMRPADWGGELVQQEDGSLADQRPLTLLAAPLSGLELADMRLYPRALAPEEIAALAEVAAPAPGSLGEPRSLREPRSPQALP